MGSAAAAQDVTTGSLATDARAGTLRIWGSPQMGDLLALYERGFHQLHPDVHFANSLSSTVSAVAGVYTKRADIGLLGREMWPTEAEAFTSVAGHPPEVLEVATGSYDVPKATFALMIFVNDSNPIASLTLPQLRRVFGASSDRIKPIRTWGDLGLTGLWAHRPIHLYGFRKENDKAHIFSRIVFGGQTEWSCSLVAFDNGTRANHSDAGEQIVQAVATDPDGIGISNVHYVHGQVRIIPLAFKADETLVTPTRETIAT
jgi:phosphate transport system substrate-binding protein